MNTPITATDFQNNLLNWFDEHGRKNLPWQQNITAYRVWVSEIMLQQTQVSTVIPYFERFIARFPDVASLAAADIDAVLELWSGLGYYARGRNLHRCAIILQEQHQGQFPKTLTEVMQLPGIGRSTAGAILAISEQQATAILDGNVKRVLTRLHALSGWPGTTDALKKLWVLAEHYTPKTRTADYTQAIMDLGATVCTRSRPRCNECPFQTKCQAYQQGNPSAYPESKPRKILPVRRVYLMLIKDAQQRILLEQRPPTGIWGGLWSLPECSQDSDPIVYIENNYGMQVENCQSQADFRHTFSHFHLDITPLQLDFIAYQTAILENKATIWYNKQQALQRGLAAPIQRLLEML